MNVTPILTELATAYGNMTNLADRLEVSHATVYRWKAQGTGLVSQLALESLRARLRELCAYFDAHYDPTLCNPEDAYHAMMTERSVWNAIEHGDAEAVKAAVLRVLCCWDGLDGLDARDFAPAFKMQCAAFFSQMSKKSA